MLEITDCLYAQTGINSSRQVDLIETFPKERLYYFVISTPVRLFNGRSHWASLLADKTVAMVPEWLLIVFILIAHLLFLFCMQKFLTGLAGLVYFHKEIFNFSQTRGIPHISWLWCVTGPMVKLNYLYQNTIDSTIKHWTVFRACHLCAVPGDNTLTLTSLLWVNKMIIIWHLERSWMALPLRIGLMRSWHIMTCHQKSPC